MKKYLTLILAGVLSIGMLTGCSTSKTEDTEKEKTEESGTQADKKEDTKKDTKDEEKVTSSTELSNNPLDNQIQIKGKVFTLPVDLKELIALGFDFKNLEEFVVNPQQGVYGKSLEDADGSTFSGVYVNLGDTAVDVRETTLTEITITKDYRNEGNMNLDVVLPGGLEFGATLDQIKTACGEPTTVEETGKSTYVKYKENGDSFKHYVEISLYDGKLISYNIHTN